MIETQYKDTDLCPIPLDWEFGCFEDFLKTFSAGATPYRAVSDNFVGSIPWVSSGELNYCRIKDTREHISLEAKANTHLTLHQKGTFLMAITGLEAEGTRGRCAILDIDATTNQSCLALNSTPKMTVEYLFWFYRFWSDYLAFQYSQGSKQQSYTANIVKKLPIYAPPYDEQEKIAKALSDIDSLISELGKLIEKKRSIFCGAVQQFLTGENRLKNFSTPWKTVQIKDLMTIHSGDTIVASDFCKGGKYPVYGANGIRGKYDRYNLDGEYILIGRVGALCGNIHITQNKVWASEHALVCYPIKDYNPYFIGLILERMNLIQYSGASAQPVIAANKLYPLDISIPSLEEQESIAAILSDMDSEIAELEKKRDKYKAVREGMMQQLLTGKIRLI